MMHLPMKHRQKKSERIYIIAREYGKTEIRRNFMMRKEKKNERLYCKSNRRKYADPCFCRSNNKNLVEEARVHHQTSPVATAALGRLLTGGVMMGSMMKNETDMLTIQIKCSGDIEGLTVTADSQGKCKRICI